MYGNEDDGGTFVHAYIKISSGVALATTDDHYTTMDSCKGKELSNHFAQACVYKI